MSTTLSNRVAEMVPTVESVEETVQNFFTMLDGAKEPLDAWEALAAFEHSFPKVVLDWMGTGRMQDVDRLAESLRKMLDSPSVRQYRSATLSAQQQMAGFLEATARIADAYLRSHNLAKYSGVISGPRYVGWRKALLWMHKLGRPVTAGELVDAGILRQKGGGKQSTADHALKRMCHLGLLESVDDPDRKGGRLYRLTWEGENVCQKTLPSAEDEFSPEEFRILRKLAEDYRQGANEQRPGLKLAKNESL